MIKKNQKNLSYSEDLNPSLLFCLTKKVAKKSRLHFFFYSFPRNFTSSKIATSSAISSIRRGGLRAALLD
jgi:hypothetical protein